MKKNNYRLVLGSPIDYEELVVYVDVDEENLGLIHMEKGKDNMEFEFFDMKEKSTVDLDSFIEALQEAKKELLK